MPGTAQLDQLAPAATPLEPVEVLLDADLQPTQFLWRERLWLVRSAERQPAGMVLPVVQPGPALEVWRASAGRGRSGPQGRYALVRDSAGGWWLRELVA
jgi:hypothetical protein